MCSCTPRIGEICLVRAAWFHAIHTQHSLDSPRAGGREKPEVLKEENNLTWETLVTLQGIYYSPRAWGNAHNIEKAQSPVLSRSCLARTETHSTGYSTLPFLTELQPPGQTRKWASLLSLPLLLSQRKGYSKSGLSVASSPLKVQHYSLPLLGLFQYFCINSFPTAWHSYKTSFRGLIKCCNSPQQLKEKEREAICTSLVKSAFLWFLLLLLEYMHVGLASPNPNLGPAWVCDMSKCT